MIVNRAQLAEILGVSRPTIDARIERGMPIEVKGSKGKEAKFDTEAVIKWHIDQALADFRPPEPGDDGAKISHKELARQKLEAETTIAQLELAKKLELVVLVEDVAATIADGLAKTRAALLNLPRRVSPLIVGEHDEDYIQSTLENEVDQLLTNINSEALAESALANDGD